MRTTRERRHSTRPLYIAILAAGKSKRMNSAKSKVLHEVCGKPVLFYPIYGAKALQPKEIFVIIGGPSKEEVRRAFQDSGVTFVEQPEPLGTGHAVLQLKEQGVLTDEDSDLLVLPGDAPLVQPETLQALYRHHKERGAIATVMTADLPDPTGYGRVVRSIGDRVMMIVEEADAFPEEKQIREVNSGVYVFDTEALFRWLPEIRPDNRQGEYYLTDVIEILQRRVGGVYAHKAEDWREVLGVNTRQQLAQAIEIMSQRIKNRWMQEGVTFIDPQATYVEWGVTLGRDVVVYPFVSLLGDTRVEERAVILPNTVLINTHVGPGRTVGGNQVYVNTEV